MTNGARFRVGIKNMLNPPATSSSDAQGLELRLTSEAVHIAAARRAVEDFAVGAGFDAQAVGQVGLCVNEALANIIRHAYGNAPGRPIHLYVERIEPNALSITLRDWGNGKNPADVPPKPRNTLEPGGVGMICLQSLMDEVRFSPQPDGMELTMIKRKQPGAP
jgi:anti-sigma regulatory factor (Ser/Thr protein kinase)